MKSILLIFSLIGVLFTGYLIIPTAFAQDTGGGVDHPGTWYVGEGLKTGDYFSYELCHVYYKDCVDFQMDWWIEGTIFDGSEEIIDPICSHSPEVTKPSACAQEK